jgi:uncharacterized protein YjdB
VTASWATARRRTGPSRFLFRFHGRIAAAILLAACASDVTGPNSHHVADIIITPDTASIVLGATKTFSAQPVTSGGGPVNNLPIFWSSSNTTVATITQGGVVTALAVGTAVIDASTGGVSPSHPAQITVLPVPVASVVVAPSAVLLRVGTSMQLTDTTKDATGHVLTGRPVIWSISDTTIAGVDQSGFVIARKPGTATVHAASGSIVGAATVTVTLVPVATIVLSPSSPSVIVGQTTQLSATTKDSAGNVLTSRSLTWFSRDTTIATIDQTGTVTGKRVASVTVGATSGGVTSTATLTVQAVPINTVVMSPALSNLLVGQSQALTAEVTDNQGNPIAGATVAFVSSTPGVATVTATGPLTATLTAVGSGQAQITGTSGTKSGTATVNVALVPVGSLTIAPTLDSITIGGTAQLTATVKDSAGNTLSGRTVAWSSSNSAVATVSTSGLVAGVGAGTVAIVATSGGKVAAATVTVKPIPVGSVAISPKTLTVTAGTQTQLTVTVTDSLGNVITNPAVAWSSTNNGIAFVSSTGLVQGVAPGVAQVIAQSGAKADTNTTTVIAAPTASVTVTPNPVTIIVGQTAILTATQKDGSGNVLSGRGVTWQSAATGNVTVSAGGVDPVTQLDTCTATGVASGGPITVTASSGNNVNGTTQVTVSNVPVAFVVLTPNLFTVNVRFTSTVVAKAYDANNNLLTGRQFTWSTKSGGSIASVDQTGLVTGVAAGSDSVYAATGGKTGGGGITVTLAPVSNVVIVPTTATITAAQTLQMSDTVDDSQGDTLQGRPVTWTSSKPGVATVSNTGLVRPAGGLNDSGTVTITVSSGGKSASATITIVQDPVATIAVSPPSSTINANQTQQLTATLTDAGGTNLTGRPIAWSSSNPSVATVSNTGLVSPTGLNDTGTVTITATSGSAGGTATVTIGQDPVGSVSVAPTSSTINATQTQQLTATVKDGGGAVLSGRAVTWTSSNPSVATVSGTGLVSPTGANDSGTVTITATTGGKSGTATVTIAQDPVANVTVTPPSSNISATQTQQLTATLTDASGATLTGRTVTWSSSNTGIATVSNTGLVSPTGANDSGTVTITATSGSASGTATVSIAQDPVATVAVAPPSSSISATQTQQLAATLKDAGGTVITGRPVTWSSSNTAVATVSNTGLVSPTGVNDSGTVTITASSGGKSGTAIVAITQDPIASVTVTPPSSNISATQTQQLTATLKDAGGTVLTGRAITWSSSNTAVATVSNTGLVSPTGANDSGTVTITATSGGVNGTAAVSITQDPVASVAVAPLSSTMSSTQTQQLTATLKDAGGTVLTGRPVTWSSSNTAIATVSNTGLVSPTGANDSGTVTITATSGGVNGTATVAITQDPVASVTLAPASSGISATQTQQLTATLKDAGGTVLTGRAITWSSSNTAIATVSNTGLVSPTGANDSGTVTITATSGGVNGTATVAITQDPVASVTLAPPSSGISATQTQQFTATLKDAGGTVLTGRAITWSSSNTAIATVSNTGLVSPTGANDSGTVTITATSGGVNGTATVAITPDPVASVTIAPPTSTISATQTQQLNATLKDAGGTVLTGRAVTWTTSDPTIATVSNTGLVSPTGPNDTGTVTITATSGGVNGTATVAITPDPVASVTVAPPTSTINATQTQQLNATLKDAGGTVLTGRTVTWTSSNTGIATVSNTGLVSPTGPNDTGTVTITATSGGANGTATVTIAPDPVASVTVAPPTSTITTAQTQQLTATLKDAGGTVLTGRTVTWTSSNTGVATISNTGLVQPVGAVNDTGTVTFTATSGSVNGTATVDITNPPVTSVGVNPSSATIFATSPSNQIQLGATTTPAGIAVTWSNGGSAIANVDGNGLVTAAGTAAGPVTITATSTNSPASGSSAITVIGHVQTVNVNAGTTTLSLSGTNSTTASAQLLDTFGTDVSSQREVTWTSSDGSTVTINGSSGPIVANPATTVITLQAVSTNSASVTITATTDDGAQGSVTITVGP